jgi:acyl transferase domain-containing protein/NADPH:quinone reductase-like Zn-dependent oxidoreductase/NADP-dependent 3-hydroxy acid dehydrogenase YdfG/acyl carrier protein
LALRRPGARAAAEGAAAGGLPIAIVGAACRLPGAPDLAGFAQLLAEGRDAVTELPAERFAQARFLHPRPGEPGRAAHFRAGTIGDVAGFDATAFGISPREAEEMDPQQRLLLALARAAFEDAGWPEDALAGRAIGVYVGASTTDHAKLREEDSSSCDRYAMTGGALSILANRIGNVLDLRGPAMTVDTACSSALVALHEAAEALRAGRIPGAVVAGVNLLLSPFPFSGFWRAGMLSPTGRCQAFGAGADGYVRAEGGVVVVLKPLAAALRDGDAVRGVILASGVNAAGRTAGISLPDGAAQAALIDAVLRAGAAKPGDLGYFEAHGTGTPAGDPIEAAAIGAAVRGRRAPLPIGSAKSNIGHTEAAAGLVGVLKALVVMETGRIPATLHAATPNPAIPFRALGLQPAVRSRRFEGRLVAVNSFGFGGTNACALLAPGPPAPRRRAVPARSPLPPLLLSAESPGALRALAASWRDLAARAGPALPALIRGQARHRALRPHRLVVRGPRPGAALAAHLAGAARAGVTAGVAGPGQGVAFVFSGNGAPWPGMGRAEMAGSPAFRRAVEASDAALAPHLGWSVAAVLARGPAAAELARADRAQPLLFALQLGIVGALAEEGIVPTLCLGHSVGEVAAAAAAGLLSLPAAARLIAARSRHQHARRGIGAMAVLGAPAEAALPVLDACAAGEAFPLEVAALNAPGQLTVAGPRAALARLEAAAAERRWTFLALDLDYAFHSAAMDPVAAPLRRDLRGLRGRADGVPLISTVTGARLAPGDCGPGYWWRNLREPVRFDAAVRAALAEQPALFLEIGPRPVLQAYLRQILRDAGRALPALATLRRQRARQADPFPALADAATALGADPRGGASFRGPAQFRGLPATPLEPVPHAVPRSPEARPLVQAPSEGAFLGFPQADADSGDWRRTLDTQEEPWLADHALAGQPVLPAAAMVEAALEAGFRAHPEAEGLELRDLAILAPLPLDAGTTRELRSRLDSEGGFRLESRRRLTPGPWTLHAVGRVAPLPVPPDEPPAAAAPAAWMEGAVLTRRAARLGLDYGPAFRPVARFAADAGLGLVRLELTRPEAAPPDERFHLHPVRLDGALQGLVALLPEEAEAGFLPVGFARIRARRGGAVAVEAELTLAARGERQWSAHLVLRDAPGRAVLRAEGAVFQRVPRAPSAALPPCFAATWRPAPLPLAWPEPPPPLDPGVLPPPVGLDGLEEAALLLEAHAAAAAQEAGLSAAEGPLAEALRARLGPLAAPDAALPEARAIWQQVLFEQPALAEELATLAAAAEVLPLALAGLPQAAARLAPEAHSLARLAAALADAAARLLEGWPAERPCPVLVAGAEEGPLTAALLAALGPRVELTVTHLPGARPPAVPEGVALAAWDPLGPEPPPVAAALVLGLGLTRQRPGGVALAEGLARAAAPGGALLLAEPVPALFWDLTEGLAAAWWERRRLLGAEEWATALASVGWAAPRVLPLPPLPWPALLVAAARPAGGQLLPGAMGRRFALWAPVAESTLSAAVAEALTAAGATVQRLPERPAPRALLGATVIALPAPGAPGLAPLGALAAAAEGAVEGFHLVTQGAAEMPEAAAAFAFGRVLANEMPSLAPRRHDLDPGLEPAAAARRLVAAILNPPDAEGEARLTAQGRLVPRLAAAPGAPPAPGPRRLEATAGQLGSLAWRPAPELASAEPGPGELRVRIAAAGLNFRDVMWAQGVLPEEALRPGFAGPGLGMEFAGTVEATGPGVAMRPGEAVFGVAPRALATRALTRAEAVLPMPEGLSPEAAAALPVAFLTAVHALEALARVQPGERVLIHGGAGALGLAALQVARALGARVAATAGTEARRAFLRAAGAEIAADSRGLGFADEIRAAWGQPMAPEAGCVDVCLNTLSGAAMEQSLALMAPFGRFLELGKRDFAEARRVALRPLRRNVAWFAVDADELARARPAEARAILESVRARFAEGLFHPLPVHAHRATEAEAAFRRLQAGGHIGKRVILPPAEPPWPARADWRPRGRVVVTGGTAGFGLETAVWLAGQGVRHLALLSRRGAATPGLEAGLARLSALGAEARVLACDVADASALEAALAGLRAEGPPIEGVVHAAAVLADGIAARLDPAATAAVWAAKVTAAEHLARLTAGDPLRLFVLFSSATVAVGSPGQGAYVAANAGLEALARRRRREGQPALAVQWGPIADAGMLAAEPGRVAALTARLGTTALTAAEALAALPALLEGGEAVAGVARLDWEAARRQLPLLAEPPFAALAGPETVMDGGAEVSLQFIRVESQDDARNAIRHIISGEVGRILRLPPRSIATDAPLVRLGLDSLGALELRTAVERRLGVSLPLQGVTEGLTVDSLAERLLEGLRNSHEAAQ